MKRTITIVAVTAAVVVLGVYAVAQLGILKWKQEKADTTIVLILADAKCVPSDPKMLTSKTGKNVTWHIINNCGESYYVSMRSFREKLENGTLGPPEVVTDPTQPQGLIPTAGGDITAKVSKSVSKDEVWKYEIWLGKTEGGQTLGRDPDLEIWP